MPAQREFVGPSTGPTVAPISIRPKSWSMSVSNAVISPNRGFWSWSDTNSSLPTLKATLNGFRPMKYLLSFTITVMELAATTPGNQARLPIISGLWFSTVSRRLTSLCRKNDIPKNHVRGSAHSQSKSAAKTHFNRITLLCSLSWPLVKLHLLPLPAVAITLTGCCTAIRTSVYNGTGQEIQLTLMREGKPIETVKVSGASPGLLRGIMPKLPGNRPDSWVVSSGTNRFTFSDISLVATMPRGFISRSRFTRDFPCSRVTQHVRIAPDMTIHAVPVIGPAGSQPPLFPIHYSTKD